MATEGFKRKLAAILGADAAGYSFLLGEDEISIVTWTPPVLSQPAVPRGKP